MIVHYDYTVLAGTRAGEIIIWRQNVRARITISVAASPFRRGWGRSPG